MASPFVPVHTPFDRAVSGGGGGKPQRASSLGSISSPSWGCGSTREAPGGPAQGGGDGSSQHQSRRLGRDGGGRSRTPPPTPPPPQSPVTRARLNGTTVTLEPSVEFSRCPRSSSDPAGTAGSPREVAAAEMEGEEEEKRPITPTVLGYEVMEERAKFTVYKILVRKTHGESWVVFRRYTDFSRINDKLKEMFPVFRLALPPKRWFKDNYDTDFLEERQLGLQAFLQNLVAHKDIANCMAVREFLCLDDPPGPFDSLEESRAFCETLEESNYRLQKELSEKQKEITYLRRNLEDKEQTIQRLERHINGECVSPESPCGLSAQGSDTSTDADVESSAPEADQDMPEEDSSRCDIRPGRSSACWCGPTLGTSPPVTRVTRVTRVTQLHQPTA